MKELKDIKKEYGKATFTNGGHQAYTGADDQLERIEIHPEYKGKGMTWRLLAEVDKAAIEAGVSRLEACVMPDTDDDNIDFDSLVKVMENAGWERFDNDMLVKDYE